MVGLPGFACTLVRPREVGGELQLGRARRRQGKVPDFKFLVPLPEGPVPRLAELKVINAGKTKFPRGKEGRGWRGEERPHQGVRAL